MIDPVDGADWLALTDEPLPAERALAWASGPAWGALSSFLGVVRDRAEGRTGVTSIDYEAYEEHVVPGFELLVRAARDHSPGLGRVVLWHRVGRVALGEASVVVVVSAPHRAESFAACRYLIDAVKETAPIWKREHWAGGAEWSRATHGLAR